MENDLPCHDLEKISCPLCNSNKYHIVHINIIAPFVRKRTNIVECIDCSLKYYNPMPTIDAFRKGYEGASGGELYDAKPIDREINFNYYLDVISKFKYPPAKILDIGCCQDLF